MPDAIITSTLTVATGLVLYGATQLAQRFWLEPVMDLMKALGRASYATTYYANVYSSPGTVREDLGAESSKELRKCASELLAALRTVRSYRAFEILRQLPPKGDVQRAAGILIGLSNASKMDDTGSVWKEADELKSILGLAK